MDMTSEKNMSVALYFFARSIVDSSESSSSDSENENIDIIKNLTEYNPIARTKIKNYVETTVSLYTDMEFKSHFRLSRQTFIFLLELLTPNLSKKSKRFGRYPITPEKQLLIAVWMLATPASYRCISDRFGVGKATAWRSVRKVVNALYSHIHTFIRWPTRQEAIETCTFIKEKYKFPGVIGAIDGTHIKISSPRVNPECYVNRKGYHSIQLQVVCDHQLKFIHCYTGQVGSVHDMRVFQLSGFENMCSDENFPEDSHLLGDSAYAIQKYVMIPFRDNGHLNEAQKNYNRYHSSARMIVERSLGLLKGRFRSILDTLPMHRTDLIPKYIIGCCILHNICLIRNDFIDEPIVLTNEHVTVEENPRNAEVRNLGIIKRNSIMYGLMRM